MDLFFESSFIYGLVAALIVIVLYFYFKIINTSSKSVEQKIAKAKEMGLYEPVSLHPVVDTDICIGSGACISACPEQDILGITNGKAATINASRCVGHGACFHACPIEAISLVMGTEKRGVELPHVSEKYESNVPGVYIAGELGGMGLIKNAVEQGKQALENLSAQIPENHSAEYDVIIIGAGPAGIAASLAAKMKNLKSLTIEQDSLGGTVYSFPRAKVVMTSPMELPFEGKIKLRETSKSELLKLWTGILTRNNISISENEKVNSVVKNNGLFQVKTSQREITSDKILLAIGRRGSPRKLGVRGEKKEKVAYKLLEPELIHNSNVLVVGGGDSAIESALLLVEENNNVTLSYRGDSFSRIKEKNFDKISEAEKSGNVKIILGSTIKEIFDDTVELNILETNSTQSIANDLVYIFAGGELPNKFLESVGITITKKFGETVLKH
ncbi:MAG: NAD(P)-binding domain-containing protein [Bacteroidetes bacterium]|nr:NAD(P)-binding domain-containing protein [Bacteroidota bacterium]